MRSSMKSSFKLDSLYESDANNLNLNTEANPKASETNKTQTDKNNNHVMNNRSLMYNRKNSNVHSKKQPLQNIDSKMYKNRNKPSAFHDLHIKSHSNVSILYADIVNFTPLAYKFEPPELVNILNKLFAKFDQKAKVLITIIYSPYFLSYKTKVLVLFLMLNYILITTYIGTDIGTYLDKDTDIGKDIDIYKSIGTDIGIDINPYIDIKYGISYDTGSHS